MMYYAPPAIVQALKVPNNVPVGIPVLPGWSTAAPDPITGNYTITCIKTKQPPVNGQCPAVGMQDLMTQDRGQNFWTACQWLMHDGTAVHGVRLSIDRSSQPALYKCISEGKVLASERIDERAPKP